jgi:hypothetical protein
MAFLNRSNNGSRLATLSLIGCVGTAIGAAGACTSSSPSDTGSPSRNGGSSSANGSSNGSGSSGSASSSGGQGSSGGGNSSGGSGSSPASSGSSGGNASSGSSGAASAGGSASSGAGGSDAGGCVPVTGPSLINFENYNPTLDGGNFNGSFGTWPQLGYIGPYAFSGGAPDGGPNYTLNPVTGQTGGLIDGGADWGIELHVMQETHFGAGLGFWMSCANASAYKGISFWVRGQVPSNSISLTLTTLDTTPTTAQPPGTCPGMTSPALCGTPPAAGACCAPFAASIPVTMVWTNVQLPWAKFTGSAGGASYTLTGADIDGLTFNMNLNYGEVDAGPDGAGIYGPTPADLDLQIDDIAFMQ